MADAGAGTSVDLATEDILGGKNVIINDAYAAAGTYKKGEILGKKNTLAGVGSADAGNTGNATFTADSIVMNAKAKPGVYVITWSSATAYSVADPDGADIGTGTIADGFESVQIDFGITVGGTAMVAGDIHYVTVSVSSVTYVTLDEDASDGSEIPSTICAKDITLSAAGYLPISFGEFQLAGVTAIMAALTTPVTVDNQIIGQLNDVGCYLKRK